jgi:hypothetical protein
MRASEDAFIKNVALLSEELSALGFYRAEGNTLEEAHKRVDYLKQVIEKNDGYRIFYLKGKPDVPPVLSSDAIWSPIPPDQEIGCEEALFRRADHRLSA